MAPKKLRRMERSFALVVVERDPDMGPGSSATAMPMPHAPKKPPPPNPHEATFARPAPGTPLAPPPPPIQYETPFARPAPGTPLAPPPRTPLGSTGPTVSIESNDDDSDDSEDSDRTKSSWGAWRQNIGGQQHGANDVKRDQQCDKTDVVDDFKQNGANDVSGNQKRDEKVDDQQHDAHNDCESGESETVLESTQEDEHQGDTLLYDHGDCDFEQQGKPSSKKPKKTSMRATPFSTITVTVTGSATSNRTTMDCTT